MERNRDLRRATVSAVNGLPRRRQRITTLRDSTDQDRQMELQETVRLGDRELLQKDREREFSKRRRIDKSGAQQRSDGGESCRENESTDSSDEEYYQEEEDMRIHQHKFSPTSSTLSNNRRGLRTLRSSPVLRAAADEMFGVPVPRRARSSSARRLQEYCNLGSGEDPSHRRFSPSPAAANPIGSGDSMKKKMKSLERRPPMSNPKHSVIQDDIEIEVAEALFDLMKQSQSQSQSSQRQEKVDRDSANTASDELKMLKADGGKDENNAFSVQNEPPIKVNAETNLADSMKEQKKEGRVEKEKFPDDPAQELVSGDGFVNKVKVGSPKESESASCVKVNACDIQDPTVTKAHYDAIIVEAKKETKLEIDLMSSPLPSSPEGDGLVDMGTDTSVIRKKSEIAPKDVRLSVVSRMQGEKNGVIHTDQQLNLDLEKYSHEKYSHNTSHQQLGRKEHRNQSPTSLLPFPIGMSSWPGVLPHPGFMPPLQAVPINGSARSSTIMQPPQFKFSKPRPKRCATHQYLAQSIHCHQQLIKKSLSSGSTGPTALCGSNGSNSPNLKYTSPNFIPGDPLLGDFQGGQNLATASVGSGKDKSSDAALSSNTTTSAKSLLHQAPHPASASSFLHGHGFLLPFGHHQTTKMAPTNWGSSQSATSAGNASLLSSSAGGRLPVNLPLPNPSTGMSLNNPIFTSNEAAASYMTMLQNNGCPIPIPTNMAVPPFKGGSPSMHFFNPSLYPSPTFNLTQNQPASQNTNLSSHKQQTSENKFPSVAGNSQSEKTDTEINWKNGASLAPAFVSHSVKPSNSQNYAIFPPASVGGGNRQSDPSQQGSKGRVEMIPQAFAFSFGSNASATPVVNFSSMTQNSAMFQMFPEMSRNGNQMIHQKNFQPSEGKSVANGGGQSFNYSRSDSSELSALSNMGPPKFDNLARNISFLPSSIAGSQPFQTPTAASVPNFQQHQMIQIQDQHMHQMHLGGNIPMFSAQSETPLFHPKWENFPRSGATEGSSQLKSSTHISFGNGGSISAASFQGHQFMIKSESSNPSLSRNTLSSQRNASTMGLAASTTPPPPPPPQEAEGGATQKSSSPACRRNVPSIVSACPTQLPELKY